MIRLSLFTFRLGLLVKVSGLRIKVSGVSAKVSGDLVKISGFFIKILEKTRIRAFLRILAKVEADHFKKRVLISTLFFYAISKEVLSLYFLSISFSINLFCVINKLVMAS